MKNHSDDTKKEITEKEFLQRKWFKAAKIDYKKALSGDLDENDWAKLTRAAGNIYENLEKLSNYWIKKADEFKKTR